MTDANESTPGTDEIEDRRKFLASCGKFAAVTPPTITLLLSTSLNSNAIASSSGNNNNQGQNNNNQR
jgi:hypothetical protein